VELSSSPLLVKLKTEGLIGCKGHAQILLLKKQGISKNAMQVFHFLKFFWIFMLYNTLSKYTRKI
jgi:hypothetical protein